MPNYLKSLNLTKFKTETLEIGKKYSYVQCATSRDTRAASKVQRTERSLCTEHVVCCQWKVEGCVAASKPRHKPNQRADRYASYANFNVETDNQKFT
jgi:hypothetical protein